MARMSVSDPLGTCEAIAADRALATKVGDYADGYRAAASDIATAIRAQRSGRPPSPLERDLRDAEIEARTLARVVAVAAEVVVDLPESTGGVQAVQKVLARFFHAFDLPPALRPCAEESTTRMSSARKGAA